EIKACVRPLVLDRAGCQILILWKAGSIPWLEAQAHRIDAVPLAGGLPGAIVEHMAKMAAAIGTEGLGAQHAVGSVPNIFYCPFHGLVEGGPTAVALELVPALKEQGVAGLAVVVPFFEM